MDSVKLFRSGVVNAGPTYFFWQRAQPYKIGTMPVCEYAVPAHWRCVVYLLGGRGALWSGRLCDCPAKFRSYMTEVEVICERPIPPAAGALEPQSISPTISR
jgi:hypothetical protein